MAQIHIQLLRGSNAGRQATFMQERITFGRSPDCTLFVDVPFASREHGEIVLQDGRWMIYNHSPNGTTVSGKTYKDDQPHPLKSGDTIGVGKSTMFSVAYDTAELPEPDEFDHQQIEEKDPQAAVRKNRKRLFLGIGIFWAIVIFVGLVLFSARTPDTNGPDNIMVYTRDQIEAEIRREPPILEPNERLAGEALAEARNWYGQIATNPSALYNTHEAYQRALVLSGREDFANPDDRLRFHQVETQLIEGLTNKYLNAYAKYRSGQYQSAAEDFKELSFMFRNRRSPFWTHIQMLWRASDTAYEQRRREARQG